MSGLSCGGRGWKHLPHHTRLEPQQSTRDWYHTHEDDAQRLRRVPSFPEHNNLNPRTPGSPGLCYCLSPRLQYPPCVRAFATRFPSLLPP
ncbi:unnamed protein product [Lota lota]